MRFGERMGFIDENFIQIESINDRLRNRIWNIVNSFISNRPLSIYKEAILKIIIDQCGFEVEDYVDNYFFIKKLIQNKDDCFEWYIPYEIIETISKCFSTLINDEQQPSPSVGSEQLILASTDFEHRINMVLSEEKSGYRLLKNKITPITNENEIRALDESMDTLYDSVNQHMQKAFEDFSSKTNPDYEGTIKNAISAVESMCSIIVGKDTTLSAALKQLEKNGVKIHPAMKDAFIKLYAYTSDETGIRHGGIDFKNAPQEDAKFMLISCSAFINYLIEKYND